MCKWGKNIIRIFFILVAAAISKTGYSQYSIPNNPTGKIKITRAEIQINDSLPYRYISKAYLKNLCKQERLKKNYLEMKHTLTLTQFGYRNWASGGENTYNGRATSFLKHSYTDKRFNISTQWDAAFGLGDKEGRLWKSEDRFQLNINFNYQMYKRWYYTFNTDFRSQFANGYKSVEDHIRSSHFLAPATLNLSLGIMFKLDDKRNIMLSPLSGNILFVNDQRLADEGAFGVEKGKKTKPNLGAFIKIQWTEPIVRDKVTNKAILSYRTNLQGFCDYNSMLTLNWESWIDFTVFKYFALNFNCVLIFDDQITKKRSSFWQFSEVIGFGITYTFKNKEKEK